MKENEKERLTEKLKKADKELVKHCAMNPMQFSKFYNRICRKCKFKLLRKPDMPFDNYCDVCKRIAEKIIK